MELRDNKTSILEILFDMFRNHSPSKIISTCEENQWKLENCIERLLQMDIATNQGAVPKPATRNSGISHFDNTSKEKKILDQLHAGLRVMVIMRGAPGSGKSYLARVLVQKAMPNIEDNNIKDFIFSTDDFFTNKRGIYNRQTSKLSEFHYFNQKQVEKKAISGSNLIVVDNTNLQIWEMLPYVKIAVKYGYCLELLEPKTPWKNSAKHLALKNSHGVPLEKIKIMLDKYEATTAEQLALMVNGGRQTDITPRSHVIQQLSDHRSTQNKRTNMPSLDSAQNLNSISLEKTPLPQRSTFRNKNGRDDLAQNSFKDGLNLCHDVQPVPFRDITGQGEANAKSFQRFNDMLHPQNNQTVTYPESRPKDLPATDAIKLHKNKIAEQNDELIEIQLTNNVIWQLTSLFGSEENDETGFCGDPNDFFNVLIPRNLAKDLYSLCCQARYDNIQKRTQKVDENFAKLVQNSKYSEISQAPKNTQELLDYEAALRLLNTETRERQQSFQENLATYLSKTKVSDDFVELPKQLENPFDSRQEKNSVYAKEDKCLALSDFEEFRNLAVHHCQLKAECYQKAKEMVQKGNNAVAGYYSQIAHFHKKKIDMYNERAANCIVEVHRITSTNGEILDLHHLHAAEAIECLDLFLDHHISNIRGGARTYKNVFIITGRGLHSTGGVSIIKSKVKGRLKDRNLKWNEANPGLLKVKVFSSSRFSK